VQYKKMVSKHNNPKSDDEAHVKGRKSEDTPRNFYWNVEEKIRKKGFFLVSYYIL
jgi:hypothetical protein